MFEATTITHDIARQYYCLADEARALQFVGLDVEEIELELASIRDRRPDYTDRVNALCQEASLVLTLDTKTVRRRTMQHQSANDQLAAAKACFETELEKLNELIQRGWT